MPLGSNVVSDNRHFCASLMADGPAGLEPEYAKHLKGAILRTSMWQRNSVVTISFLEGDPGLQERVKAVAREWVVPGMARLIFDFRPSGSDTDIRIAFQLGAGSWSYLGTQCRLIQPPKPTMNYGWLTPTSSDDELRRVVLHEFGHAIGLIHEHQNPDQPIQWNRDAVIHDLKGAPNFWDEASIENNMFKRYNDVISTPLDPESIMMYPIPAAWTLDGFTVGLNSELSEEDRKLVRQVYG